jgi:hypothetical protein
MSNESFVSLWDVVSAGEVVQLYGLQRATVSKACIRGRIAARKSGGTWLMSRHDAEKRWGKRK